MMLRLLGLAAGALLSPLGVVLLLAGRVAPVFAQEEADSVIQLDAIVVTVTRTEQRVADIPSNTTVLTRRDIERNPARTVDDLLRQIPGFNHLLQLSSFTAHPAVQTVSLRGLGGSAASRALVLLDGVPLNDPFIGWVPWNLVPLESLERIEIVRGGSAGVWGNLALSGVIHLITKEAAERSSSLSASGGGQSTYDLDVAASDSGPRGGWTLHARRFSTEGYQNVDPAVRGTIDTSPDVEFVAAGGALRFGGESGPRGLVRGIAYSEERDQGTRYGGNATDIGLGHARAEFDLGEGTRLGVAGFVRLQGYENRVSSTAPDRNSETPSLDESHDPSRAAGIGAAWSTAWGRRHKVSAGFDLQWVETRVDQDFLFQDGDFQRRRRLGGEQLLAGAFVSDGIAATPEVHVLAGVRLDGVRNGDGLRREQSLDDGSVLVDERFPTRWDAALSTSLGARYQISARAALRGAAYRSFRAPTLNELYRPFRFAGNVITESNSDLEPERLTGVETGIDLAPSPRLLLRGTVFWNRLEDPIYNITVEAAGPTGRPIEPCGFVPAGGVCRETRNVDAARTRGLEAEFEARPDPVWRIRGNYLYDQAEVTRSADAPELKEKWIRQSPRHSASLGLEVVPRLWLTTALTGRYVGRRFDDDLNTLEIDDFFVADLRIGARLSGTTRIHATIENLFDARAEVSRTTDGVVRTASPRLFQAGIDVRL